MRLPSLFTYQAYKRLYPMARRMGLPEPFLYGSVSRLIYFSFLYEQIKDIEGSIVECGVGSGHSLILLGFLVRQEGKARRLYGFDSFELGFPQPKTWDLSSDWQPAAGDMKSTQAQVRKLFKNNRCGTEPILIPGFFGDSLPENPTGPVALLHIDCDLYEGYKDAMDHLYPLMPPGAIMTFDEYGNDKWPGAARAVDDFVQETSEELRSYEPLGVTYIVKGKKELDISLSNIQLEHA